VALVGALAYDLSPITADIDGAFLEADGLGAARRALAAGDLVVLPGSGDLRVGAPIARPSAVVCVGQNYVDHAAESGSPLPASPIMFLKPPNTVIGPNDPVAIPPGSTKTDWEVELGAVISRRAAYLASPGDSIDYIAGFVACNDVSERDHQIVISGGQWSKGKSSPGFCPIGPWLATPDEIDYRNVRLRSWVNGQPRQDQSSTDMIFGVDFLIWHLSQYMALEPGDLILTGTPAGVALSGSFPYLRPGDEVRIEIDGLGTQQQRFIESPLAERNGS
jgi:2-keto-4-pentenoate hydratase/2-oxohepta-3-ene-1,7-dioic acid hydratase in catechol pathway